MEIDVIEHARVSLQGQIDSTKTQQERNKLGQFATPTSLARDILQYPKPLIGSQGIRFLDPAFGTGSFYSALLQKFSPAQIVRAEGYEIDSSYGLETVRLWQDTSLELHITDFTKAIFPVSEQEKANLLICNPPYVRHHHLSSSDKTRLLNLVQEVTGLRLNGLSGLYCYFLCIAHAWLANNGIAGWLIPSEFMDVKYGEVIKTYLTTQVTLQHIHRFKPEEVQFDDALTSSAVVWFTKTKPPTDHQVKFTYGGSLLQPDDSSYIPLEHLGEDPKWTKYPLQDFRPRSRHTETKLADLFEIKRGLATGANQFFILTPEQVIDFDLPSQFLQPILPSPRYVKANEIEADKDGNPIIDRPLFLLNCDLPPEQVQKQFPTLWAYFRTGIKAGIHERYLSRHRTPWYAQEKRPAPPILCTYMGRNSDKNTPFRFLLNHSQATATNVYLLLYPKPFLVGVLEKKSRLLRSIWQNLNEIPVETLIGEGRVYGGGLHKIEPKELGAASAETLLELVPKRLKQLELGI